MAKKVKKTKLTGKETGRERFEKAKFKPGESGNPAGRPFGARSYATIYREALIKLAKSKGKTPEELEDMILQVGIAKAIGGDYRFYQDVLDRGDGKPIQQNVVTVKDGFAQNDVLRKIADDFIW